MTRGKLALKKGEMIGIQIMSSPVSGREVKKEED